MQEQYEHCLPKKPKIKSPRLVITFRSGKSVSIANDTGCSLAGWHTSRLPPNTLSHLKSPIQNELGNIRFGHPIPCMREGGLFSRAFLYSSYAHRSDMRGVNGNIKMGCDSIVVSRQDPRLQEEDNLQQLKYTSSRAQGGGALWQSFFKKRPIRVFRSSKLRNLYPPPNMSTNSGCVKTLYRYDGLYTVETIWDNQGSITKETPKPNGGEFTFLLTRLPSHSDSKSLDFNDNVFKNFLSLRNLWNQIKKFNCFPRPIPTSIIESVNPLKINQHGEACFTLIQMKQQRHLKPRDKAMFLNNTTKTARRASILGFPRSLPISMIQSFNPINIDEKGCKSSKATSVKKLQVTKNPQVLAEIMFLR
mmetsp:Transcript_17096/g.24178  ORF Transcript_17096/g.24178 Transcript_17096/m.24178 type:complete len:362 (-) Transcript_17096:674-1759(-)